MTSPKEIYDTKRNNFVNKIKLYFEFLTSEFGFNKPNHKFSQQPNCTIINDTFEFINAGKNLKILILNSYHPIDYGFEINLIDLITETEEMIYNVLKENQDVDQNYLEKIAQDLRNSIEERLNSKL